jgi:hypothetical protein
MTAPRYRSARSTIDLRNTAFPAFAGRRGLGVEVQDAGARLLSSDHTILIDTRGETILAMLGHRSGLVRVDHFLPPLP